MLWQKGVLQLVTIYSLRSMRKYVMYVKEEMQLYFGIWTPQSLGARVEYFSRETWMPQVF